MSSKVSGNICKVVRILFTVYALSRWDPYSLALPIIFRLGEIKMAPLKEKFFVINGQNALIPFNLWTNAAVRTVGQDFLVKQQLCKKGQPLQNIPPQK